MQRLFQHQKVQYGFVFLILQLIMILMWYEFIKMVKQERDGIEMIIWIGESRKKEHQLTRFSRSGCALVTLML